MNASNSNVLTWFLGKLGQQSFSIVILVIICVVGYFKFDEMEQKVDKSNADSLVKTEQYASKLIDLNDKISTALEESNRVIDKNNQILEMILNQKK
jgi:hypothetical protein